jgi:hypothetical protein
LLFLLLVAWVCYLPALHATFFSDDNLYLSYKNAALRDAHWTDLGRFFLSPGNPWEYLPLRDVTYWLDFQLYEDESVGFHLTNLLWYAAASAVVWWLIRELLLLCGTVKMGDASTFALIGAVIFAAHPAHVEAVAWIASRKDLVGGTLGMVVLAFAVRFARSDTGALPWGLLGALLLIASFGKSTAMVLVVMVAAVILAAWNLKHREERSRLGVGLLLVFVPAVVALFIHSTVAANTGIRLENEIGGLAMIERGSRILVQLIWMLVFPSSLGFYHDPYSLGEWHWLLSLIALLLNGAALISLCVRPQLWAFGILLISVSLLPYLQFVPYSTWSLASERFLFVAVAGVAMIATDLASRVRTPRTVLVLLLAIMALCAVVILERLEDWRSVDQLRAAEQDRLPDFHNSKRDLIVYQLLPDRQYEVAVAVAASLPRDYVRDLMKAYVDYREVSDVGCLSGLKGFPDLIRSREVVVWAAVSRAQAAIRTEPDLSLNNIVRWVEQNMPQRNAAIRCRDQLSSFGSTMATQSDNRSPARGELEKRSAGLLRLQPVS